MGVLCFLHDIDSQTARSGGLTPTSCTLSHD